MGFSGREYWSGLPCSLPEDFLSPGTEPAFLMYPALASSFFTTASLLAISINSALKPEVIFLSFFTSSHFLYFYCPISVAFLLLRLLFRLSYSFLQLLFCWLSHLSFIFKWMQCLSPVFTTVCLFLNSLFWLNLFGVIFHQLLFSGKTYGCHVCCVCSYFRMSGLIFISEQQCLVC